MLSQFSLYAAHLFSQPKWKAARRTVCRRVRQVTPLTVINSRALQMQDWIMAMAENPNISIEDRRRILDALPLLGGVDKEAFLKAIGVYRK